MQYPELLKGHFISRDNRFSATVEVEGSKAWAHVPNSGRLRELFTPGRPVWVSRASNPERKTAFDLKLVEYNGVLVSVDARLPNPLFAEALAGNRLADFPYPIVDREVTRGHSRLDFLLQGPQGRCWVETKSITLVEDGTAMFPDAPTERGRKHLFTLIDILAEGDRAAVVFVVQRPDARRFRPHPAADPLFAEALKQAATSGVEVKAYTCDVSRFAINLAGEVPVYLS